MKNTQNLGWMAAALMAGVLLSTGFQTQTLKVGVVDVSKILETSNPSSSANKQLEVMKKSREDLLEFISQYLAVATEGQINKLKEYAIKEAPLTDAEKKDEAAIKTAIMNEDLRYKNLAQKAQPTAEETKQLNEFGLRDRTNKKTLDAMLMEFRKAFDDATAKQSEAVITKAKSSLEEIAKAGGYTVILDRRTAPWGANDVTDDTLKAMNKP